MRVSACLELEKKKKTRRREWTQIIAGMRKVNELVQRKGEKKRKRGIQRGREAKWMFWDNSTDELGNRVDVVRTCKENEEGVSEWPGQKGQIRLRKGDGKVEKK